MILGFPTDAIDAVKNLNKGAATQIALWRIHSENAC